MPPHSTKREIKSMRMRHVRADRLRRATSLSASVMDATRAIAALRRAWPRAKERPTLQETVAQQIVDDKEQEASPRLRRVQCDGVLCRPWCESCSYIVADRLSVVGMHCRGQWKGDPGHRCIECNASIELHKAAARGD